MAGVGAALPDALQYFRIATAEGNGRQRLSALRITHPTAELLDACDRLGMIVMDENRLLGSDAENLAALKVLSAATGIIRAFSSGAFATRKASDGAGGGARRHTMQDRLLQLDPTRPITAAESVGDAYSGFRGR